jgi:hypothetical protein
MKVLAATRRRCGEVGADCMSVTDFDSPCGGTIATRNSGAAVVTDTDGKVDLQTRSRHSRRPAVDDGLRRFLDAQRYAEICGRCGAAIPSGAPVALRQRYRPSGTSRFREVTTCLACAARWLEQHRPPREACPHCCRPVYRRHGNGRRFCCDRCEWLAASASRRARTAARREKACAVCGHSFTATRVDARTCGPACRQRGYRRRFADTKASRIVKGEETRDESPSSPKWS